MKNQWKNNTIISRTTLKSGKKIIVPELNYLGQWSSLLRMEGYNAESITQYTGLPFRPADLVDSISELIGAGVTA